MTDLPVCLMLIVPRKLRDELFEYLSEQTDLASGFTASDGAGHGAEVRQHTAAERVKGHADQAVVRVSCRRWTPSACSTGSGPRFSGPSSSNWILPVAEFGIIG
jgi:hypothetical protein